MPEAKRQSTIVGCLGVLCLGLYWAARFVPGVAAALPDSSFGKFVVFGIFLTGTPLTTVAAIRGSNWWWVAVATGFMTLVDVYMRFGRALR
jgi:hypothetical protein